MRERGLKLLQLTFLLDSVLVAPVRERGLKCNHAVPRLKNLKVAPVRERGLKYHNQIIHFEDYLVAPVRERGLKCTGKYNREGSASRRSREGAWIEIAARHAATVANQRSLP